MEDTMSKKINIIDAVIAKTGMKQMNIANTLGVSRAQISKWKSGEDIPHNRKRALAKLAGMFDIDNIEWSLLAKTPENAENWIKYFSEIHEWGIDVYSCSNLTDEPENFVPSMLVLFNEVGVKIPELAPVPKEESDTDGNGLDDDENDKSNEFEEFESLVRSYLESYAALINWYNSNIFSIEDENMVIFDKVTELKYCITDFAIINVDKDILFSLGADLSKVKDKAQGARKEIVRIIRSITEEMLNNNMPIMKDYFDIINKEPYDLDDEEMFDSIDRSAGEITIESYLPLFERTVLQHIKFNTEVLGELHLKIDMLLSSEDRKKLSKILKHTRPLDNELLNDGANNSSGSHV